MRERDRKIEKRKKREIYALRREKRERKRERERGK